MPDLHPGHLRHLPGPGVGIRIGYTLADPFAGGRHEEAVLDVEALTVEPFATTAARRAAGTVRGHGGTSEWDREGTGAAR